MAVNQVVDEILERDAGEALARTTQALGPIAKIVAGLSADADNLLGFILVTTQVGVSGRSEEGRRAGVE